MVLQLWTETLTLMQQSVLIASVRGPDGIKKNHVAKLLLRWLRRCFLISAFDKCVLVDPMDPRGGSFTGPSICAAENWEVEMDRLVLEYLSSVDELPHHFQLHFMHASEILGYKHPDTRVRTWWNSVYLRLVNDLHLFPESEAQMDYRLGDRESQWRQKEEVVARGPQ